jgi:hypothetical protein
LDLVEEKMSRLPLKFSWMKSWMFFFSPSLVVAETSYCQSQLTNANEERYKSIMAEILGDESDDELGSAFDEYDSEDSERVR